MSLSWWCCIGDQGAPRVRASVRGAPCGEQAPVQALRDAAVAPPAHASGAGTLDPWRSNRPSGSAKMGVRDVGGATSISDRRQIRKRCVPARAVSDVPGVDASMSVVVAAGACIST
jgi:hypothetical protein